MSGLDAFERILTSLHEAMLDDVHWPTTTALIDEACGLTSNALLVGKGPKDDLRVLFVGLYGTAGNDPMNSMRWGPRSAAGGRGDSREYEVFEI